MRKLLIVLAVTFGCITMASAQQNVEKVVKKEIAKKEVKQCKTESKKACCADKKAESQAECKNKKGADTKQCKTESKKACCADKKAESNAECKGKKGADTKQCKTDCKKACCAEKK